MRSTAARAHYLCLSASSLAQQNRTQVLKKTKQINNKRANSIAAALMSRQWCQSWASSPTGVTNDDCGPASAPLSRRQSFPLFWASSQNFTPKFSEIHVSTESSDASSFLVYLWQTQVESQRRCFLPPPPRVSAATPKTSVWILTLLSRLAHCPPFASLHVGRNCSTSLPQN